MSLGTAFSETPTLFGTVHIFALIVIALGNAAIWLYIRNLDEKRLLRLLNRLGLIMLIAEAFKQWYCYVYIFDRELNLWFLPWQLCSMAMYCSFLAVYLKGKPATATLVFLATYSLVADVVALILPYDMLRPQVVIVVHSFAYHGLVLTEAIAAILILYKRAKGKEESYNERSFLHATILFAGMAVVAEIINVISHAALNDISREPNMFYITPTYPTTQPILHDIAVNYGILAEIIIYLALIILVSYIAFLLEKIQLYDQRDKS